MCQWGERHLNSLLSVLRRQNRFSGSEYAGVNPTADPGKISQIINGIDSALCQSGFDVGTPEDAC